VSLDVEVSWRGSVECSFSSDKGITPLGIVVDGEGDRMLGSLASFILYMQR
jgi:hypothetical protein